MTPIIEALLDNWSWPHAVDGFGLEIQAAFAYSFS